MQLWRRLRHWSVASSIMLCCIPVQPSIRCCLKLSTSCILSGRLAAALCPRLYIQLDWGRGSWTMNAGVSHSMGLIVSCARVLGHCLAERWRTRHRSDIWQAATVVTVAHHANRLHWPWLGNWRISNWSSLILTCRLTPSVTDWIRAIFEFHKVV